VTEIASFFAFLTSISYEFSYTLSAMRE
jgi:hypothetical protein